MRKKTATAVLLGAALLLTACGDEGVQIVRLKETRETDPAAAGDTGDASLRALVDAPERLQKKVDPLVAVDAVVEVPEAEEITVKTAQYRSYTRADLKEIAESLWGGSVLTENGSDAMNADVLREAEEGAAADAETETETETGGDREALDYFTGTLRASDGETYQVIVDRTDWLSDFDAAYYPDTDSVAYTEDYGDYEDISENFDAAAARERADGLTAKLGGGTYEFWGEQGKYVSLPEEGRQRAVRLDYVKAVDGIPVNYILNQDDTGERGQGALIAVILDRDRLLELVQIGDLTVTDSTEGVFLLPFSDILGVFESAAALQVRDYLEAWGVSGSLKITRISLGYAVLHNADGTVTLSPVWDFYGKLVADPDLESPEEIRFMDGFLQETSWIAVDAMDGSILEQSLFG